MFIARSGAAVVFALLVGTGGLSTATYIHERNQRGYRFGEVQYDIAESRKPVVSLEVRSAADNLERVRAVFEPSVTDLASLFNVSRQTIYNWQAGQPIAPENEQRLEQLARAADVLEENDLARKPSVLRRSISGGKNFFELTRAGSDPVALTNTLVRTIQNELAQRKQLGERLANRRRKAIDLDDVGTPHFDERA
jgi:hypothetical protein